MTKFIQFKNFHLGWHLLVMTSGHFYFNFDCFLHLILGEFYSVYYLLYLSIISNYLNFITIQILYYRHIFTFH